MPSPQEPIKPQPGQESVWDYPRPPRLEQVAEPIRIEAEGVVIAQTTQALRVLETSHPPVYYIPPGDIQMDRLRVNDRTTFCEFKGRAGYYNLTVPGPVDRTNLIVPDVGWFYPSPVGDFAALAGHVAFYPSKVACFVNGERASAQEGDFYGGWITSRVVGPFKGPAGTSGW